MLSSLKSVKWAVTAIAAVAATMLTTAAAQAGPVLHVDDDAPLSGDGLSWNTAYRFLQDALVDASGGGVSEVRVAQGIYKPDQDEAGNVTPGDREATFQLITDVALRGGYAGLGAPDPDERDIDLYETVLSGDLLGDDGPDFANNEENSYNVVTGSGTDETAVLDGFSVTAGNANGPDPGELNWIRGAGMWNFSGSPTVNDCKFQKNRAQWIGGGMYNRTDSSPTVLGCTFNGNVAVEQSGGGMFNYLSSPTVSNCIIVGNFAQTYGGGMFNHTNSNPTVANVTFNGNVATERAGGGMYNFESSPTVIECTFSDNLGGGLGGGGIGNVDSSPTVVGCTFIGNSAEGAGGGMLSSGRGSISLTDSTFLANCAALGGAMLNSQNISATLQRCTFTDNEAAYTDGALFAGGSAATLISCTFIRNSSNWLIGGMSDPHGATLVNCVFSRNTGDLVGGLFTTSNSTLINSTFSGNFGGGITFGSGGGAPTDVTLANCILWGNTPYQIEEYVDAGAGGTATVSHSDIQGGWSGPGGNNIDADPLFVQPGLDNVRLSFGSPCINVGSNAALPPDELDLDGDGDTDEPIPYDLDGDDRIQAGIVDMGAYEGEHDPLPPGSSDSNMDLDQGEIAILIPGGGPFNPLESTAVMFTNVSGPDNASVTVTEWFQSLHPGAGGYSDLTSTLIIETSLDDGQFLALVFLPFNPDVLGGIDPFQPNLTYFDPTIGNWALAVAGNTVNSPGFPWPIGDRVIVEGPGGYELTQDLGDYGVYWMPSAQQGFVWANVDYAADLALGAALCPPDCRQTPDGVVDVLDILAVLTAWGGATGNGPCDLDNNGSVDQSDLLAVLSAWGPCSQSANSQGPFVGVRTVAAFTLPSQTSRVGNSHGFDRDPVTAVEPLGRGDLDGNGRVDRNDLLILRSSWGPCADGSDSCPTDLDGDGEVDILDLLTLLDHWG